jgi:hypothetical protein
MEITNDLATKIQLTVFDLNIALVFFNIDSLGIRM